MAEVKINSGGIGLFGVLFIVFLVLKLCSVINWSWWWVTVPLWGPTAFVLGIVAIFAIIALFLAALTALVAIFGK